MKNALIFDAHGVLYRRKRGNYKPLRRLLKKQGLKLRRPWVVYDVVNRYAKTGLITKKEMIDDFLKVLNIYSPEFTGKYFKLFEKLKSKIILFPHVKDALKKLCDMGLKLYVFSDSSTTSIEKLNWFKNLDIAEYFDKVICSCDVGYLKNDVVNFKKFLRMINVKESDAVFVYHELGDVVSAKLLGLTCVSINRGSCEDYYIRHLGKLPSLLRRINP